MSTLQSLIADAIERLPHKDAAHLRQWVFDQIADKDWRSVLAPIVEEEIEHRRRDRVRAIESASFRNRQRGTGREVRLLGGEYEPDVTVLRRLLHEQFALGNGTHVVWGEANEDEHQQRIDMLAKQESSLAETRSRHELALRMIRTAGVTCLNEVFERGEAA